MLFSHFFICCIHFVRKLPRIERFVAQLPRSLPETRQLTCLYATPLPHNINLSESQTEAIHQLRGVYSLLSQRQDSELHGVAIS
jgi:hypothetical protein